MVKKFIINLNTPWFNSINFVQLLVLLLLPYTSAQGDTVDPYKDDFDDNFESDFGIFAIIIFLLVVLLFCYDRSDAPDIPVDVTIETSNLEGLGDVSIETSGVGGLDSAVIETFPVFVYIDEFGDEDLLRLLPCHHHHVFHPDCIDNWFVSHSTCPLCDAVIDAYEDDENPSEGTVVSELEHHEENRESVPLLQNSEQVVDGINLDNEMSQLNARKNILRTLNRPTAEYRRSHSTGHLLIRQGLENSERYMLRLPDGVRKDIIRRKSLNYVKVSVRSSHHGRGGSGGTGSSNRGKKFTTSLSDRWVVSVPLRVFARSSSCV
ncbi:hypothetical protein MKW98_028781 [Papaver atlanticum]|uniref:RING-type domain-containing protein n=1 Tax=Papaver atlanticum TaxID=357466 RepID=A0AAD4SAX6_9MAGN|nr:hypothetical protein MKW98_028781 [Papaver atlanticum]